MRTIIFFLFISVGAFGQQNFKYENNQVVWEKVFDTELTQEEIKGIMKNDPWLSAIADDFEGDTGRFHVSCDQKISGVQFYTTIDFKDKRYRVKINHIQFAPSRPDILFGEVPFDTIVPFEPSQVNHRKGELLNNKVAENSRECLNTFFQKKFSFKNPLDQW